MKHSIIRDYYKGSLPIIYYCQTGETMSTFRYLETVNDYKEYNTKQLWYNDAKCAETIIPWLYDAEKDTLYICDSETGIYSASDNKEVKFSVIKMM